MLEMLWLKIKSYPTYFSILIALMAALVYIIILGFPERSEVGGVLSSSKKKERLGQANEVPASREVSKEQPGGRGYVQGKVEVLEERINPFRDKDRLKIEEEYYFLPEGVKDFEVDEFLRVELQIYGVEVLSRPEGRVSE